MIKRILSRYKINPSRIYLERFCKRAGESVDANSMVLDAGAGEAPYKKFFSHAKYESADFCEVNKPYYDELTYVCSLEEIPVDDNRYDTVVLTQVLEHLPNPQLVLAELHRTMKPGGKLWLTAPLFYHEHEQPYDFFRYTQFALKKLCDDVGFEVDEIEWLEGYYATLAFQLDRAATQLPWKPKKGAGLLGWVSAPFLYVMRPMMYAASIWLTRLEFKNKVVDRGQCKNYALIATKKTPANSVDNASQ